MTVHIAWPRVSPECGTRVTSIHLAPPDWASRRDFVYIGMPCRYTAAHPEIAVAGFGKPWACLSDPDGWRAAYRRHLIDRLRSDRAFRTAVRSLHGKTLVCFCKGSKRGADPDCHGDLLTAAAEHLAHRKEQ